MYKSKILTAVMLSALSAIALPALAAQTSIKLINDSNSSQILINSSSTGTLSQAVPNPLFANDIKLIDSDTAGTVDAGLFVYQSCRFNWSVIKLGSIFRWSHAVIKL